MNRDDQFPEGRADRRRGVAIILVLGLLATLMLMAVAFSISMRIERRGAGNFRYEIQAKHLLWAALANAINDINGVLDPASAQAVGSTDLILQTNKNFSIYPEWPVLYSTNENPNVAVRAALLSQLALEHVPDACHADAKAAKPEWIMAPDNAGRYAYLVINTSGFLDANRVDGAQTNRWTGVDPLEIRIDALPDINSSAVDSGDGFRVTRDRFQRIETLPELRYQFKDHGLIDTDVSNLVVYSRSIEGEHLNVEDPNNLYRGVAQINVGTNSPIAWNKDVTDWKSSDWANFTEVRNAFILSGVTNVPNNARADRAAWNLFDYCDSDSIPRMLNNGCVESVPMINEIILAYQADFKSNQTVNTRALLQIEWIYPFVTPPGMDFSMHYEVEVLPGSTDSAFVPQLASGRQSQTGILGGGMVQPSLYGLVGTNAIRTAATSVTNASVAFQVKVMASVNWGTNRVDEVPSPNSFSNAIVLNITNLVINVGETKTSVAWAQCVDPRFNWDPSNKSGPQWYNNMSPPAIMFNFNATPLAINDVTRAVWDPTSIGLPPQPYENDKSMDMFVANRPLRTVGELGHLCFNDEWSTIRLYDHGKPGKDLLRYHKVFDYFAVDSPGTVRRGRVNVNSLNTNVLGAVFYEVPDGAVGHSPTNRLDWDDARSIAEAIKNGGPYTNLSDLCWTVDWKSYTGTNASELAKEGLIRNSIGLLTLRDNLFTVIIKADCYSLALGGMRGGKGMSLATVHGIAEIWRDPFRDANGKHKVLIRSFRMLEE